MDCSATTDMVKFVVTPVLCLVGENARRESKKAVVIVKVSLSQVFAVNSSARAVCKAVTQQQGSP